MTNAQAYKKREQENKEKVLRWLKMSDEDHFDLVVDTALEYLKNVLHVNAYGLEYLSKSTDFWTWWRIEWNRIDTLFLDALKPHDDWYVTIIDRDSDRPYKVDSAEDLRSWYSVYHEASMENRFINAAVVRATAESMLKGIRLQVASSKEVVNG
jgi:hypothetical protein